MKLARQLYECAWGLVIAGGLSSSAWAQATIPTPSLLITQETTPGFTPIPVKDSGLVPAAPVADTNGSEAYPLERWLDMKTATF